MSGDSLLLPLEGEQYRQFALDREWFNTVFDRPRGITFMVRAKNEEATIAQCLNSIQEKLSTHAPELQYDIVLVDNGSTDDTVATALAAVKSSGARCTLVAYPMQIAKAGLETYVTPCNSAHSFPWFTQYCTMQCKRFSHVFRWDADFCMTDALAQCLADEFAASAEPADAYDVSALHENNEYGREIYLLAVRRGLHYRRSFLWEHWDFYDGAVPTLYAPKNVGDSVQQVPSSANAASLRVFPQKAQLCTRPNSATSKRIFKADRGGKAEPMLRRCRMRCNASTSLKIGKRNWAMTFNCFVARAIRRAMRSWRHCLELSPALKTCFRLRTKS